VGQNCVCARAVALTIVRYRATHALTQEDLAEAFGVPLAEVDCVEWGEAIPVSGRDQT
jgi:DNA-binding XRE family transcriptional regulator